MVILMTHPGICIQITSIPRVHLYIRAGLWVDVKLPSKNSRILFPSMRIKSHPKLKNMLINRKGNRLSITPVTAEEWRVIKVLGE